MKKPQKKPPLDPRYANTKVAKYHAEGVEAPEAETCPHCHRKAKAWTLRDVAGREEWPHDYVCWICVETADAKLVAAAESIERELKRPTWGGVEGQVVRDERNRRLEASLNWVMPGSPLTPKNQAEWAAYRRELNRLTKAAAPADVRWPTPPAIIYDE